MNDNFVDSTSHDSTIEAQGICLGCEQRYLFVARPETQAGTTTETNAYCECETPQENAVTVVFDPDRYDLVDPFGDGDLTLRAACQDCGEHYYGAMRKPCYNCGCQEFRRWVVIGDAE